MSGFSSLAIFAAESASHGAEAGHAAKESAGISALGVEPWAILAQAVTFLLLFWIVKRFALDKIVATLEERRKTIDNGVRLGRKMEAEEAKLEDRIEESLRKTRGQADKIIAQAQSEAGEIIKAAEDKAAQRVDQMLADAHAKIQDDMLDARKALQKDMQALVAQATEAVLEEKLDAQKDESLIHKALTSMGIGK